MRERAGLAVQDHAARYRSVRALSLALVEPLSPEDQTVQSMPDASPAKWHLAHTTWFFETFLLKPFRPGYRSRNESFEFLFNSYYNGVGPQFDRPSRGLITRPGVQEVLDYRAAVDEEMGELAEARGEEPEVAERLELGLQHEQQHQELLLMDVKHAFSLNPLSPAYGEPAAEGGDPGASELLEHPGGPCEIGHAGEGFAYDNEGPRHTRHLAPFRIASRLVTNGEYLQFVEDGGYERPLLWLADGWEQVRRRGWRAPEYWRAQDGSRQEFTLGGVRELALHEPVVHLSFYEADAYARWAGARLPLEEEWETLASARPVEGNFLPSGRLHPEAASLDAGQWYGDAWEWTSSPYVGYPGFRPASGAIGEYNGKFMCNQMVMRGGSCLTPGGHMRATYRSFFYPHQRWQVGGLRLARDVAG